MIANPSKSAMVFSPIDTFDPAGGAVALALGMCPLLGARLTAVLLDLQASTPGHEAGDAATLAAGSALSDAARAQGVDTEVVTSLNHSFGVGGCLADRLRLHDVGIIGTNCSGLMSERMLAEHLLFDSGRPVIVTPRITGRPLSLARIVVAWDNTRPAARALNDAIALFGATPEYVLLSMDDDKAIAASLDAADLVAALQRRGLKVAFESGQRGANTIGDALQQAAIARGADLLAMGGFAHSRLREALLGGATAQVLDDPQLPVLLSH